MLASRPSHILATSARAASMRDRILSREHTAAAAATTSLSVPLAALLYVFVAALLYPMVLILLG